MANETPEQAARRLAKFALAKGFIPVALHTYTDTEGRPLYWRMRLKHSETAEKWIRPMRLNGQGYDLGEPKFDNGKPLYTLPRIAGNPGAVVWIVEGEQKADALNALGLVATTSGSATSAAAADWEPLRGRTVTIWPDNDDAGKGYASEVTSILLDTGCLVSCLEVGKLGLGEGEDVMEWLSAHSEAARSDVEVLPKLEAIRDQKTAPADDSAGDPSGILYRCMADVRAKPIRWLWPGRIARGKVSLIVGHPGLGKSQVTAGFAAIVSTGGFWPVDRTHCERGRVLLLSAEDDPEDTIRPRLEAANADLSRIVILDAVRETNQRGEVHARSFNLNTDVSRLGALIAKLKDVALIVIDPISAYLGAADSHNNAEVRALLTPLAELAARHGVAVVCVSHLNKSAGSEALLRVQGSVAFGAAARAVWGVARDKEIAARRLFLPLKNNLGTDQTGLAFAVEGVRLPSGIDTSRVVWEGEPVTVTAEEAFAPEDVREEKSAIEDAKPFLVEILADGPVPSKQIRADAEGAGYSWRTIQRVKKMLGIEAVKAGMAGGWVWKLPPKERQ